MGLCCAILVAVVMMAVAFVCADVGDVCGEDGTIAVAALENLEVSGLSKLDPDAVRRCGRAFFARSCAAHGAAGFESKDSSVTSPATNTDDLACFASVCSLCARETGVVGPRGGFRESDETETLRTWTYKARRTLCSSSVCASVLSLETSSTETARISAFDIWTTGWYASWLTFLSVDVIVAASLSYWSPGGAWHNGPGPHPGPTTAAAPVVLPVLLENVLVDPYWSPSVFLPEVVGTPTQNHDQQGQYGYTSYVSPPPTWSWPPPPPPPPSATTASGSNLCSVDDLASALPSFASSLVPCLGGASSSCCSAIVAMVGSDESAALPSCLCALDAYAALTSTLEEISVPLETLLEACNEDGSEIPYHGGSSAGTGSCDQSRRTMGKERDTVREGSVLWEGPTAAVVRARRTGARRNASTRDEE